MVNETDESDAAVTLLASPFLKWTGGKDQILPEILPRLPKVIDVYNESFIGGGSVFFALANEQPRRYRRAVISDINLRLAITYSVVRDFVEPLIEMLERIRDEHIPLLADILIVEVKGKKQKRYPSGRKHYERLVHSFNDGRPSNFIAAGKQRTITDDILLAALFIAINKLNFRGMFRENQKGEYNVPYGNYGKPNICNAPLLRACSAALQGVEILSCDFEAAIRPLWRGDAIYADPPYVPASATASFTQYSSDGFDQLTQVRLARCLKEARSRGVAVLTSNSDTPQVHSLYNGLTIDIVEAKYGANPHERGEGSRKTTREALITL